MRDSSTAISPFWEDAIKRCWVLMARIKGRAGRATGRASWGGQEWPGSCWLQAELWAPWEFSLPLSLQDRFSSDPSTVAHVRASMLPPVIYNWSGSRLPPNLVFFFFLSTKPLSVCSGRETPEKSTRGFLRLPCLFCFLSPGNKRVVKSNVYNNLTDYLLIRY